MKFIFFKKRIPAQMLNQDVFFSHFQMMGWLPTLTMRNSEGLKKKNRMACLMFGHDGVMAHQHQDPWEKEAVLKAYVQPSVERILLGKGFFLCALMRGH